MKYKLNKDTIIKEENNKINIYDVITTNNISLSGIAKDLFYTLIQEDDNKAMEMLFKLNVSDELEARKTLNSLLYSLINLKLVGANNVININDNIVNITTGAIETTNVCNFRCPHCYVDKARHKTLSFEKIKNIIDDFYELGASNILFTGGEVLTHPNFKDFYIYAYKKGFIISINTNGSLINDDIENFLKEYPPCTLEISIYGDNQKTYNNFTKANLDFDNFIEKLKKLKNCGINLLCKGVITNSNKDYYFNIVNMCNELNIPFKKDYIAFPQLDKIHKINPEQISPEEVIEILKKDKHAQMECLKRFSQDSNNHQYVFECRRDNDALFINSNGYVNICPCMQSVSYKYEEGKLLETVLELRKIGNIKFKKETKCKNCKYMSLCRYCPAKFELTTGNYEEPPVWFCKFGELMYKTFIQGIKFANDILTYEDLKNLNIKEDNKLSNLINNYKKVVKIYSDGKYVGFILNNDYYINDKEKLAMIKEKFLLFKNQ